MGGRALKYARAASLLCADCARIDYVPAPMTPEGRQLYMGRGEHGWSAVIERHGEHSDST